MSCSLASLHQHSSERLARLHIASPHGRQRKATSDSQAVGAASFFRGRNALRRVSDRRHCTFICSQRHCPHPQLQMTGGLLEWQKPPPPVYRDSIGPPAPCPSRGGRESAGDSRKQTSSASMPPRSPPLLVCWLAGEATVGCKCVASNG